MTMEKMEYKLTTVSSLIVSPRSNAAWYKDLEGFSLEKVKGEENYLEKTKLNIIYPFYQYGEYTEYNPENAEYYLPGSSVKGMLCQGTSSTGNLMVDDVPVCRESIVLRNLFKAQYMKDEQKACFGVFFENVGIEMIKADTELTGEIYIKDNESMKKLFSTANQSTKDKLTQMSGYLNECIQKSYSQELKNKFKKVIENISSLLNHNNLFLLGGYKGLLLSMKINAPKQKLDGAIFLDTETMLPHGLVRLKFINL